MKQIKAETGSAPFAGSGKLSDFKKDGSWMMNQISKGYDKVQRGINVKKDGDHIRFAKMQKRIACNIVQESNAFVFSKEYICFDDNCYLLSFKFHADLNGIDLRELNIVNELMNTKLQKCMDELYSFFYNKKITIQMLFKKENFIDANEGCIITNYKIKTDSIDSIEIEALLLNLGFCKKEIKVQL